MLKRDAYFCPPQTCSDIVWSWSADSALIWKPVYYDCSIRRTIEGKIASSLNDMQMCSHARILWSIACLRFYMSWVMHLLCPACENMDVCVCAWCNTKLCNTAHLSVLLEADLFWNVTIAKHEFFLKIGMDFTPLLCTVSDGILEKLSVWKQKRSCCHQKMSMGLFLSVIQRAGEMITLYQARVVFFC